MRTFAVDFNPEVFWPTMVLGVAAAGLYGLLSISLVLTYRVSRTIGFVQGGLALFGCYLYWWLTNADEQTGHEALLGAVPAALVVAGFGAVVGVVYGSTVTGKLAAWPRVRLTTYSLGWLLALFAAVGALFSDRFGRVNAFTGSPATRLPIRSMFGDAKYEIAGAVVTIHQVATLVLLVVIIAGLSFLLLRTRTGVFIRAIADDPEAGRWVGVPLGRIGTGVYAFSGALAAFAGVLLASTVGVNFVLVPTVFLRALTVTVLGGFTNLPLALAGCLILGVGENTLSAGLFGTMSGGRREIIIMTVLFGLVVLINHYRKVKVIEAASQ